MRILALAVMLLPAAASAADRDPPVPAKTCKTQPVFAARPSPAPNGLRKLDELPAAEAYYAVLRFEDGCEKPVKVREYQRGPR